MKKSSRLAALAVAFLTVLAVVFGATSAFAAAGQEPEHVKELKDNGDGTYKLSLNVTGDAEKVAQPVNTNVIVILDTSGSMAYNTGNTETTYTPTSSTGNGLYGLVDGEYIALTRDGYPGNRTFWYRSGGQWIQYTGQRYTRQVSNQTRLEAAQDAINDLAEALLSKNGQDGNPNDLIQMALVTFDTTAQVSRTPTTNLTQFQTAVNNANAGGGTNWEAALTTANNVNFNDQDQTFVIFVSDGNPTFRTTQNGWNDWYQQGVYGDGQEGNQNVTRCYTTAVPAAKTLANKVTTGNFFTIGAYGNVDRMESLTTDAGAPAANYFSAENTAALQEALASILEKIEMAGIAEVEIEDGTTNQVQVGSTTVSLLNVDTSSFKYYRAGGDYGDVNGGLGTEWTSADNPAPPEATLTNGQVEWDLSELGVLENGVTYTVTFDVWPSQEALDYVADMKNGESVPNEVKQYLNEKGELKTNTTATLSYDDTRTPEEEDSIEFDNPEPVGTSAVELLTIAKEWENNIDPDAANWPPVELNVTRDGDDKYKVTLSDDNDWQSSVYISYGIMRGEDPDNMEILASGHDFTFTEPEDIGYRWELDVPVVRPMLINGTPTTLIKVDDAHPAPSDADVYTIEGVEYYVDEAETVSLTATNYRRSQLVLTKEVEGEGYSEDTTFSFELMVNNSKANSGSADNFDSDHYVWFFVLDDENEYVPGLEIEGAEPGEEEGYYYAESGATISAELPADYKVWFINLPAGSTYSFNEVDLPTGFIFKQSKLHVDAPEGTSGDDETFIDGRSTTGTVAAYDCIYTVVFTNEYQLVDVTVNKKWVDDSASIRPNDLTLTLNGLPEGTEAPKPTVAKDGDTWTYTWKGVPKYDEDGEEIEYTVSEDEVPEGYECTGSPAKTGGTITNKLVITDVTVTKVWSDNDDEYGLRPDELELTLTPASDIEPEITKSEDGNTWTYTWKGVPKYGADGKEIEYTVSEETVPAGYECTGSPAKTGGTITNKLALGTVKATIPVTKELEVPKGLDGPKDASWTVKLEASTEGAPMPTTTTGSITADNGFTFGEIEFSAPGVYEYSVSESGSVAGVKNDPEAKKDVTVTVEINDDGKLEATVSPEDGLTFTNTYSASGEIEITAQKELVGRDLEADQFEFELLDENGEVIDTAKNDAEGVITFDAITVDIPEADASASGDEGDAAGGDATSDATGPAMRSAAASMPAADEPAADDAIVADEAIESESVDDAGEPDVADAPAEPESEPVVEEGDSPLDLVSSLADILDFRRLFSSTVALADEPANSVTLTYTIREVPGSEDGYTYDENEIKVTVTVTDKGDGTLETSYAYDPDPAVFTNTYEASGSALIEGSKSVEGADLEEGQFEFKLSGNGVNETVSNDADGNFSFTEIEYDQDDAGKTFTYTMTEVKGSESGWTYDDHKCTVNVEVTDNGNGKLTCDVSYSGGNTFTNTYKIEPVRIDPPIKKVITGDTPSTDETFTFQMKALTEGAPMPEGSSNGVKTKSVKGAGEYEFGWIEYTEEGTYEYEVSEVAGTNPNYTYDSNKYTITVEVTEEDGKLVATVTGGEDERGLVTFTNSYEEPPAPPTPKPPTPKPPAPKPPAVPKTGDETPSVGWIALLGAGLVAAGVLRRRMSK